MVVPKTVIEEIRTRAQILDVVSKHVELRKQGKDYIGLCPFHPEKTPSFSVSEKKNFYYCFGCQAAGDALSFVMKFQGMSFGEAAENLAGDLGIQYASDPLVAKQREKFEKVYHINQLTSDFFGRSLRDASGMACRRYVQERGVLRDEVNLFQVGFGGASTAYFQWMEKEGVRKEDLVEAGLLTEDKQRLFFDGRMVFPIRDERGKILGFGGRRLRKDGFGPKYLNSKDMPWFSKNRMLFGVYEGQKGLRQEKTAVVVEGFLDVLAAHRAGVENVVASLGTAFNDEHVRLCGRFVERVTLVLDGDDAGIRAAYKASLAVLKGGLKAKMAILPEKHDPDSFIKEHGPEAFRERIREAEPAIEVLMNHYLGEQADSVESRVEVARQIQPLLSATSDGLERDLYMARLAEAVGVSIEQLKNHLKPVKQVQPHVIGGAELDPRSPEVNPPAFGEPPHFYDNIPLGYEERPNLDAQRQPEKVAAPTDFEIAILKELSLFPQLRVRFEEMGEYAQTEEMETLCSALALSEASVEKVVESLGWSERARSKMRRVFEVSPLEAGEDVDVVRLADQTFKDALDRLKAKHLESALDEVKIELTAAEKRGEEVGDLARRRMAILHNLRALQRKS
ncbi:MAG: DNA primase [Myxococcota bacterium]|nr:DNA primase [Myxococcota bacterium]